MWVDELSRETIDTGQSMKRAKESFNKEDLCQLHENIIKVNRCQVKFSNLLSRRNSLLPGNSS